MVFDWLEMACQLGSAMLFFGILGSPFYLAHWLTRGKFRPTCERLVFKHNGDFLIYLIGLFLLSCSAVGANWLIHANEHSFTMFEHWISAIVSAVLFVVGSTLAGIHDEIMATAPSRQC